MGNNLTISINETINEDLEQENEHYKYYIKDIRCSFWFWRTPSEKIKTLLRNEGFKLSPTRKAWERMNNRNGYQAARRIIIKLNRLYNV